MIKCIYGSEPYFVDREKKACLTGKDEMDIMHFDKLSAEVYEWLASISMFGDRVAVVSCDTLPSDEVLKKAVERYKDSQSLMLLLPRAIKKNTASYKFLKKMSLFVDCDKSKDERVLKKELLAEAPYQLSQDLLAFYLGRVQYIDRDDLSIYDLRAELQALYDVTGGNITKACIEEYVDTYEKEYVFSLIKHIKSGNTHALRIQCELLSSSAIGPLSVLLREFRIALKANIFSKEEIGVTYLNLVLDKKRALICMHVLQETIDGIKVGKFEDGTQPLIYATTKIMATLHA